MKKQLTAFTLAEVLITVGIIGVVAALTVPTVVKNIQNAELKTAFKKSYTNLTNVYNEITFENGGVPYDCYYDNHGTGVGCINLFDELKMKLKVIKTYSGPVDGINISDYTSSDSPDFNGTSLNSTCSGAKTADKALKQAWVLADGAILISYKPTAWIWAVFILDTNGLKKPNKWGYDLFVLNFKNISTTNGAYKVRIEDNICGLYEKGGFRVNDILMNK